MSNGLNWSYLLDFLSSLALRKESISSSHSDCSADPHRPPAYNQDHLFMKSVSEPSINTSTAPNPQPYCSPSGSLAPPPTNTNSMPSTPETSRSMRPPPPRPSSQTPSTPAKVRITLKIWSIHMQSLTLSGRFISFLDASVLTYVLLCLIFYCITVTVSTPVKRIHLIGRPPPLSVLLYPDAQKALVLHDPLLLDMDFLSLNVR